MLFCREVTLIIFGAMGSLLKNHIWSYGLFVESLLLSVWLSEVCKPVGNRELVLTCLLD